MLQWPLKCLEVKMNLNEWNKLRDKRNKKPKLSKLQIEAGISNNPADYYFAVFVDQEYGGKMVNGKWVPESRTCAMICPRKFFDKEGYCWDNHLLHILEIPGFAEDMEAMISPAAGEPELEPADMHELLLDIGLVWTEKFANFINRHDPANGTVYFPKNT